MNWRLLFLKVLGSLFRNLEEDVLIHTSANLNLDHLASRFDGLCQGRKSGSSRAKGPQDGQGENMWIPRAHGEVGNWLLRWSSFKAGLVFNCFFCCVFFLKAFLQSQKVFVGSSFVASPVNRPWKKWRCHQYRRKVSGRVKERTYENMLQNLTVDFCGGKWRVQRSSDTLGITSDTCVGSIRSWCAWNHHCLAIIVIIWDCKCGPWKPCSSVIYEKQVIYILYSYHWWKRRCHQPSSTCLPTKMLPTSSCAPGRPWSILFATWYYFLLQDVSDVLIGFVYMSNWIFPVEIYSNKSVYTHAHTKLNTNCHTLKRSWKGSSFFESGSIDPTSTA